MPRRQRGIVLIWVLVTFLAVVGLAGLAIDVGYARYSANRLQIAADAASLAGAAKVTTDPATAQAGAIATGRTVKVGGAPVILAAGQGADVILGRFDRQTQIFQPTLSGPNAVKVIARRSSGSANGALPLLFGPAFGVSTVDVERVAIAMVGGGTGAGLIVLNRSDPNTFSVNGNPNLVVQDTSDPNNPTGGAIQVNSVNTAALDFSGKPTVQGSEINVCAPSASIPAPSIFGGTVNVNQPAISDPLAGLPVPPLGPTRSASHGPQTLQPGYYPYGLSISKDTTLQPGIYVLGGEGLSVSGNAAFAAIGVMIYLLPTAGGVNLGGTGAINIQPMPMGDAGSGAYGGIAIWQAAGNTNPAAFHGSSQFTGINGTLYFPTAQVGVVGTSDSFSIRQLICNSVSLSGNGTVQIAYDGRFPAPGTRPFLVDRGGAP